MKLILENWREYLNEELLTEFDKTDKETLMAEQDRFTISYEIELESRDAVGDTPQGRREHASNYLTFDYFADNWNERESSDFWHGYLDEGDPDPLELVTKYLLEEYPTRAIGANPADISAENLVRISIAIREDEKIAKEFKSFYNNILKDGTRENKTLIALINKDPDIKEALKKRGVQFQTAKQGRLPFDAGVADDEVVLNLEPDALKEIVHTHLFNPEDVVFFPSAGTDLTIDLTDFLYAAGWEDESSDWIGEADDQIKNFVIDGGTSNYPTIADISYFNRNNWGSYHLKAIAGMVESAVQLYIEEGSQSEWDEYQDDPEDYLDNMGYEWEESYEGDGNDGDFYELMEENFPRFMKKWADQLKFEPDGSLRNGIEFSMDDPKFITGLDTAFEFLKDFFFDYNRQDNFQFDVNTGLHTNIGYLDEDGESHKDYNLMKALLFLNHDFAFKEFGERKGTRWATDLKSDIAEKIEKEFKEDRWRFRSLAMKLYKEDKLDELGHRLSAFVDSYAPSNPKSLGFNIHYIDKLGYVEFRYPGGKGPTLEKMKKATLYYAYVIKQAVDPEYKKKEYQSKLVKLMTNLASHVDRPTEVKKIKAFMKKDEVYLMPTNVRPVAINSYMQHVLDHSIPYSMYGTEAGIFKGIRKGKTLKDTLAVFKVVEGTWDHLDNPSVQMTDRANYKIGERTIPLPELERMITNDSLDFVNSNSTEERIRDIFKIVEAPSKVRSKPPAKKRKREDKPPWIAEDKMGEDIEMKIKVKIKSEDLSIGKKCPAATQDLKLNTKNRDASIHADHIKYGPLNVDEPGDYWKDIAEYWETTEDAAKKSLCGNCVAFDISPRMDECMPGQTSDDDGRLGYCWMHHFKCHSARSCYTWAKGGPIKEDKVSFDWQERNEGPHEELEEKKKKTNCFQHGRYKTFKGKSKCIQRAKGLSKERADAYVASVLRDMGEIDERRKKKRKKKSSGKKDACYHKVKARYKVWPSAYASGALVKCRKVGAKNWGKSKKK